MNLGISKANDAWIFHREEFDTIQDGNCNAYFLIDAYSSYCFGHLIAVDFPASSEVIDLLEKAHAEGSKWPNQILIDKKNPYVTSLRSIAHGLGVPVVDLPATDMRQFISYFLDSLKAGTQKEVSIHRRPLSEMEKGELKGFIPDSYDPCPCASSKKFKFCCQKGFYDIAFAMCAAEEGDLNRALSHMQEAESKVGKTAEVLCRLGICWSYFDRKKSDYYLSEAIKLNKDHPRTNYILGIRAKEQGRYTEAIEYYKNAIEHYPKSDRYHLNETYNNLGSAYYTNRQPKEAKEAWEKALVLFPTDPVAMKNMIECIYENPTLEKDLKEENSFMRKYLLKNMVNVR